MAMKRLEYLRTIVPSARRLCWLWGHDTSLATRVDGSRYDVAASLAAAARKMQFETRIYRVTGASDIDKALADAATWQAQALTTSGFPPFLARREVARFALRQRLPSAFAVVDFVQAGGLLSYGVPDSETQLLTLRWIDYIDRVLRGAKPADMPVIGVDGVIGTTQRVAGDRVDVQLTVDSGFGVDIVVERTGARGYVRGTGDLSRYVVRVEYVQRTDEVE